MAKDIKRPKTRKPPEIKAEDTSGYPTTHVYQDASFRKEIDHEKKTYVESHVTGAYKKIDGSGNVTKFSPVNEHTYNKGTSTITIDGFEDYMVKGKKMVIKGGNLLEFGGDLDFKILGSLHFIVAKNFKITAENMTMSAEKDIYHHANEGNIKQISGKDTIHTVGANYTQTVAENSTKEIKKDDSTTVKGDQTAKIDGKQSTTVQRDVAQDFKSNLSVQVAQNSSEKVGSKTTNADQSISKNAPSVTINGQSIKIG